MKNNYDFKLTKKNKNIIITIRKNRRNFIKRMLLVQKYNEATNQYHIDLSDSFYRLTYSDCIDNIKNCIWQLHKQVESNCYVVDSSSFNKFHTCWNYNETGIVNKSSESINKLDNEA